MHKDKENAHNIHPPRNDAQLKSQIFFFFFFQTRFICLGAQVSHNFSEKQFFLTNPFFLFFFFLGLYFGDFQTISI